MFSRIIKRKYSVSSLNIFESSIYNKINFRINENNPVQDAAIRFSAFNIDCLAVIDNSNKVVGLCNEHDYIKKVAILEKGLQNIKIKDICNYYPNVVTVKKQDTLETCIHYMNKYNSMHALVIDDNNPNFIGIISIKDLVQEIMKRSEFTTSKMSDYKSGGIFWL